uniref:Glyoxylate reductase/hydroxypyruvate reductase n=1 Tax=Meloidogyne enterolobii TaxID=390850 RepID=A0A6V7TXY5_MELEN|nr:unnamed protein product [Meloidogyne enterolobii]
MRRVVVSSVSTMMSLNSAKPKILMTDSTFNLTKLKEIGDVIQHDSPGQMPRTLLEEKIVDVDALFCLVRDKIDSQILEKAKNLKMIGTMSVGYEHINLEECKRKGIRVGYTPVAELGMALILATARRLPEAINSVKSGGWRTWSPYYMCGKSLANSVVGIYGLGKIGTSIANKIQPFMPEKIIYNNRKKKEDSPHTFVSFNDLLAQSDFLIITATPSPENTRIFNKNSFKLMKKDSILINISRGVLVNHNDLADALTLGLIGGAGLDVTDPEPFPLEHPLHSMNNCVILPHIGSATYATRNLMAATTEQNIINYFKGIPMVSELLF